MLSHELSRIVPDSVALGAHLVLSVPDPMDQVPEGLKDNPNPPQIVEIIRDIPKYCKIPVSRPDLPARGTIEVVGNHDFPGKLSQHDMMLFLS